jgi:hypothetical protein
VATSTTRARLPVMAALVATVVPWKTDAIRSTRTP